MLLSLIGMGAGSSYLGKSPPALLLPSSTYRTWRMISLRHSSRYAINRHAQDFQWDLDTPQQRLPTQPAHSTVKRKVALHIGYSGTGYRGLQAQGVDDLDTLEAALLKAIHLAGGFLETNVGQNHRQSLSRSSRTDKGVHSLATVIALKMECPSDNFHLDPEGTELAKSINEHLPKQMRVFSVQRVNKSFNARIYADMRTYQYHLPLEVLGLQPGGGHANVEAQDALLQRLNDCLKLFVGRRVAYHNFTQRRRYRTGLREQRSGWRPHALANGPKGSMDAGTLPSATPDPELLARQASNAAASSSRHSSDISTGRASQRRRLSTAALDDSTETDNWQSGTSDPTDEDDAIDQDDIQDANAADDWRAYTEPQIYKFRWQEEIDHADKIEAAHYRHIYFASATLPGLLVPNGTPCVRISFTGQSFMLHQIRHMVGAAVAVALNKVPLQFVRASLCAPARADFPLAPAQVLLLSETAFSPFPKPSKNQPTPAVSAVSGDSLSLRKAGQAQRDLFCSQVLNPALDKLLVGEAWNRWMHELGRVVYPEEAVRGYLASHAAWIKKRDEALARKTQEHLQEAAVMSS